MRMILILMLTVVSGLSYGICSYPLDATNPQYGSGGVTRFSSISSQSASTPITTTPASYYAFGYNGIIAMQTAVATDTPQGDISLPSSGIMAIEFSPDNFPAALLGSSGLISLSLGMVTGNNVNSSSNDALQFNTVLVATPSGAAAINVANSRNAGVHNSVTSSSVALGLPLSSTYRVGYYFNATSRGVGYTINGVDYGYVPGFSVPAGVGSVLFFVNSQVNVSSGSSLSLPLGGTIITDAAQMTEPFPSGAVDICGVPL